MPHRHRPHPDDITDTTSVAGRPPRGEADGDIAQQKQERRHQRRDRGVGEHCGEVGRCEPRRPEGPGVSTGPSAVFALLRWFRRLRTRWKIREAFLTLGRSIIWWRRLKTSFCKESQA